MSVVILYAFVILHLFDRVDLLAEWLPCSCTMSTQVAPAALRAEYTKTFMVAERCSIAWIV